MKNPAPQHHVHKEVDPQSTQHHRDVQRIIDTPQQPPAGDYHAPATPETSKGERNDRLEEHGS